MKKRDETYTVLLQSLEWRYQQKLLLEEKTRARQEKERLERETADNVARERAERESVEKLLQATANVDVTEGRAIAFEEQLVMLRQGAKAWNRWRDEHPHLNVSLRRADLSGVDLRGANLRGVDLEGVNLSGTNLMGADLSGANLADVQLEKCNFEGAQVIFTVFRNLDLSKALRLEYIKHAGPSSISTDTFVRSKGNIPEVFIRGCGLSDWEIEAVKLYNPDLSNEERNKALYKIYDLQASQAIQVSALFISYNFEDSEFVDKLGTYLEGKGIRYWRDAHNMKARRIETPIDRSIRQNPTVLLILSEHSLNSDWIEHEIRAAREIEKESTSGVLCPIALDESWKSSQWPKRVMEQIMEYNILDFSSWKNHFKFEGMFRGLVNGLELFYKG